VLGTEIADRTFLLFSCFELAPAPKFYHFIMMADTNPPSKTKSTSSKKPKIRERDIVGLKYFDQLAPLLQRLHDDGCERDTAPPSSTVIAVAANKTLQRGWRSIELLLLDR